MVNSISILTWYLTNFSTKIAYLKITKEQEQRDYQTKVIFLNYIFIIIIILAGPMENPQNKKFQEIFKQERMICNFITCKSYCCFCDK